MKIGVWLEKMRHYPRMWLTLFLLYLLVLVVLSFEVPNLHPHFPIEKIVPGFWSLFGLVVAFLLARLSKGAAHKVLGKDEDFYDR